MKKKKTLFTSKLGLKLKKKKKKKLVKCSMWSIALYGAEIWTLWKVEHKYLESFENVVLEKKGDQLVQSYEK